MSGPTTSSGRRGGNDVAGWLKERLPQETFRVVVCDVTRAALVVAWGASRGAETRRENDPSQQIVYEPKILSLLLEAWFLTVCFTVYESRHTMAPSAK